MNYDEPNSVSNLNNPASEKENAFDPIRAETALWTAVITQALMDAGCESKKPEAQHDKVKAIRWLTGFSEDFVTVCLNASLDPAYVHRQAQKALTRGCAWRQGLQEQRMKKRLAREKLSTKSIIHSFPVHISQPLFTPQILPRAMSFPPVVCSSSSRISA